MNELLKINIDAARLSATLFNSDSKFNILPFPLVHTNQPMAAARQVEGCIQTYFKNVLKVIEESSDEDLGKEDGDTTDFLSLVVDYVSDHRMKAATLKYSTLKALEFAYEFEASEMKEALQDEWHSELHCIDVVAFGEAEQKLTKQNQMN